MSGVTLTANKVAPQLTGTTVTFTAAGAGGVAPYAYKFILTTNNWASYTVVQDWSASATFTWTPATPNTSYQVGVGARSAWDTADAWEAAAAMSFPITSPAVLTVAVQGSGSVTTGDGFITCPAVACSHSYTGLPTVALWTVVVLAQCAAFSSRLFLPSVIRGQPGPSIASMCRALSA